MLQIALLTLQIVGAVSLGFVAPGYCLARCLRAGDRLLWSFPLSLVVLFLAVFAAGCLGLPVTATVVAAILLPMTLILAAIGLSKGPRLAALVAHSPGGERRPIPGWIVACILGALGALLAVVIWRTTLWPLSGFDNRFRWNFLARRILQQQGFGFYPPVTAADYRLYFYPDGIPPLTSFAYWWLYAATGGYHPALTSMLVAGQLACILGFTYRIGRALGTPLAGLFSAAILGGSSLMVHSVAIGQETGLTALAVAAMICAVVEGTGDAKARPGVAAGPTWQTMILAGLAAGLGALAREYGCAFPILGGIAVLWLGGRLKHAAILCATAVLVAGPWYLRNLLRAGNPFYSERFGPFYVNPMQAALLDYYRTRLGVSTWDVSHWAAVLMGLLSQAPLQMTVGVLGMVILFRKLGFLAVIAGAIGLLWIYSIGATSGGWEYSARLLSSLLVVLSIPAGILLAQWSSRRWVRAVSMTIMGLALLWSIAAATVHPLDRTLARFQNWTDHFVLRASDREEWWGTLATKLPPGSRVLCDDAYIYSELQERGVSQPGLTGSDSARAAAPNSAGSSSAGTTSGLDLVPVWSPEVAFIADDRLAPAAIRAQLLDRGIRYVIVQNNFNGQYFCNHIRFYREGVPSWTVLYGDVNVFYVFDLADDTDEPAIGAPGG